MTTIENTEAVLFICHSYDSKKGVFFFVNNLCCVQTPRAAFPESYDSHPRLIRFDNQILKILTSCKPLMGDFEVLFVFKLCAYNNRRQFTFHHIRIAEN